ncbi:MAG: hypothetical protein ABIQ31_05950 [Ferruginibacter sp.]
MAKQIINTEKESPKGKMLKDIVQQLSQALPALKEMLGEKKFEKRIKKAAKLLSEGIKPVSGKKTPVKKATAVKPPIKKVTKTALPEKKSAKPAIVK